VRKTYHYRLRPSPIQEQALDTVLLRCRTLYNCAVEQRKTWWERGQGKSANDSQQATELPDLKAACREYAEVHSQVLQDVLRRVDKTYQAFLRRIAHGDTPGYPRFQGPKRYHSFTYPHYGTGAVKMALARTRQRHAQPAPRSGVFSFGCIARSKALPRPSPS